jgi:RNA polymerase sigma-70 factor (sigma-E family)
VDEFTRLVAAQWDGLYRLARLLAGSDLSADDLVQAALVKAVRSRSAVLGADVPAAYLRRIVATVAIDESNRRRRIRESAVRREALPDPTADVDRRDELWPLIAALPPRQRAVVVLRFYEDLSEREIAAILRCRPGTVKSQCAEALRKLRVALGEQALAEGDSHGR